VSGLVPIEVEDVAVLLRQPAVPVVANAGGDAQGRRHLELVLDEEPGLVGAIIAIGVALQEAGCRKVLRGQ
jgi:molybdopterin-guanine dinucleotide biosynthesis protein A